MSENAGKYGSHRKIGKNGEKKVKLSGYYSTSMVGFLPYPDNFSSN